MGISVRPTARFGSAAMTCARNLAGASALALAMLLPFGATSARAAPILDVTAPLAGSSVSSDMPPVQGLTSDLLDPVTVELYAGTAATGTPLQTLAAGPIGPAGEWSALPEAPLPDGQYTVLAEQSEGGEPGASEPVTFTVDTVPPAVSIEAPAPYTNDPTPTLRGDAGTAPGDLASVLVRLYAGEGTAGTPVAEAAVTPVGESWSYTAPALADGTYTVQVSQRDEAGNEGVQTASFTVDTVAPAVTLEAPPKYTNDVTPTFRGGAGTDAGDLASVLVRIYEGTTSGTVLVEEAVTPAGESWSYTAPSLADGTYTVQVSQRDEAGNEGVQTGTFTVDTVAPDVTLDAPPKYTNDVTPTFHGAAGTAPGDLGSVLVRIYEGEGTSGKTLAEEAVKPSAGEWYYKASKLEEGTYTIRVSQLDEAGDDGVATATFTVDTTAPTVTIDPPPAYTNKTTTTVEGHLGQAPGDIQAVTVTVYEGTKVKASDAATVSGADWSYTTPNLPEGTYTVQASQRDEAGNVGLSAQDQFIVDLTPPVVSVSAPGEGALLYESRPTFAGSAGVASGDLPTVTVEVYQSPMGAKPIDELQATVTAGRWSVGSKTTGLPDGVYTVIAKQKDQAGNVGESTPVSFTVASSPLTVTLALEGSVTREGQHFTGPDPTFSGTGSTGPEDGKQVVLKLYSEGSLLRTTPAVALSPSGTWSAGLGAALPDGTYTVQAEQEGPPELGRGLSQPLEFTVDADPPVVTMVAPANGATVSAGGLQASGSAGVAPGDDPEVTLKLYAGAAVGVSPLETIVVARSGSSWSAPLGGLSPGTYTAQAEQGDDVGNVGLSAPSTFTVAEPAGPPPPSASFSWFPADPHVGEPVQLASTSSDPTSAIVGYAWDLAGAGQLTPGGQTIDTTFTTPGEHAVALMVTDALGASSTVTESVPVSAQPLTLMQPFPIVRIAGSEGAKRVTIKLLTVQAPAGADITITCRGRGCPTKRLSAVEPTRRGAGAGAVLLAIRRFERQLPAGVVLEIRVGKAGEIGKYTKFVTRPGRLPVRTDSCLAPDGSPMECPAT